MGVDGALFFWPSIAAADISADFFLQSAKIYWLITNSRISLCISHCELFRWPPANQHTWMIIIIVMSSNGLALIFLLLLQSLSLSLSCGNFCLCITGEINVREYVNFCVAACKMFEPVEYFPPSSAIYFALFEIQVQHVYHMS